MKQVYSCQSAMEAQMIVNLLAQYELHGEIMGKYLQGGMGELPAVNLIKVMVPDSHYARAREIVDDYDAATPVMPDAGDDDHT